MPRRDQSTLNARLARVKILLCDVDGVLTDGTVLLGERTEYKAFNIQDGLGLLLLARNGIKVGWISSRPSRVTQQRAAELKIDFLYQKDVHKVPAAEKMLAEAGLSWDEVCYMGDDVVDLGVLERAGVAIAVANAIDEVKKTADYVTKAAGGHGAVREVVRMILLAQHKWEQVLEHYRSGCKPRNTRNTRKTKCCF